MPAVRSGPLGTLLAQVCLLAALAVTVGLGVAGWAAGLAYGLCLYGALALAMNRRGAVAFHPADRVTSARAVLAGGVTALVAESLWGPVPVAVLVTMTAVALSLDAVDGLVARRTGTGWDLGARYDMEVDAFLILVLSLYVADALGAWVVAIGAMRYAFVAASWLLPWMRATLPPRFWRKAVAAVQGIALTVAAAGVLPRPVVTVAVAASLALLVESFGRDVTWLWRVHARSSRISP
jgi:phosphatidylglycerophosphate synthase